jgi:hypothetical protein
VDLFVVGLQEMVKLDVMGSLVCKKDEARMLAWEQIFKHGLQKRIKGTTYKCMMRKVMFGCFIMLFVKEKHTGAIKNMHTSKIKTGVHGMAANKGSTSIRFNYDDTSLFFLNCHLSSG